MSDQTAAHQPCNRKPLVWGVSLLLLAGVCLAWPEHAANAAKFVLWGLIVVAPIVIPGILLAAWIIASGADTHIAGTFDGKTLRTVLAASLIGAITPVCGVTVLPLMAGLLAAGCTTRSDHGLLAVFSDNGPRNARDNSGDSWSELCDWQNACRLRIGSIRRRGHRPVRQDALGQECASGQWSGAPAKCCTMRRRAAF